MAQSRMLVQWNTVYGGTDKCESKKRRLILCSGARVQNGRRMHLQRERDKSRRSWEEIFNVNAYQEFSGIA